MRIKKKDLLEAFDAKKVANDLDTANELVKTKVSDFKKTVKTTLGDDDKAGKIADELTGAIISPKKIEEETEEVKPKKRVKEVVKVKNLKK